MNNCTAAWHCKFVPSSFGFVEEKNLKVKKLSFQSDKAGVQNFVVGTVYGTNLDADTSGRGEDAQETEESEQRSSRFETKIISFNEKCRTE